MTTSFPLDARQRAMLDEMGVRLIGWPTAESVERLGPAEPAAAQRRADAGGETRAALGAARPPGPAPVPSPAPAPAQPRSAAPTPTPTPIPTHGAAVLAEAPRRLDDGAAALQGGWLIVADMPPGADGRHGEPFASEAGQLLANMLRALRLLPGGAVSVHLMRSHRGVASGQQGSPAAVEQLFASALEALAPRVVLAMGPLAAQSLLQSAEPLGRLRGRALALPTASETASPKMSSAPCVVATYHPAYLLRNPADKARAWADLCLAAARFDA